MADFHEIPFSAAQCIFFHCDETRDLFPPYVFGEIREDFLFFFFLFSVIEEENVTQNREKQQEENVESLLNDEPGK